MSNLNYKINGIDINEVYIKRTEWELIPSKFKKNNDPRGLWAMGSNAGSYVLGLGSQFSNTGHTTEPTQVGSSLRWKKVVCNDNASSVALRTDGTLWTWGWNGYGQLGIGNTNVVYVPTQVGVLTTWKDVASGWGNIFAINNDGTLWACGYNDQGQLGLGHSVSNVYSLIQVGTDTDWKEISITTTFTVGLKTNGTLWVWGQLVNTLTQEYLIFSNTPTQVGTDTDWKFVSAGGQSIYAIKENGSLWSFGNNAYGQLGLGDTANRILPTQVGTDTDWNTISGGNEHVIAIKTNGSLWGCGHNQNYELGIADQQNRSSFTQIGTLTNWLTISCGFQNSMAIKNDGTLWSTGSNSYYQLGFSDNNIRSSFTQVGNYTSWRYVNTANFCSFAISY